MSAVLNPVVLAAVREYFKDWTFNGGAGDELIEGLTRKVSEALVFAPACKDDDALYLVVCGGDGYATVVANGLDRAIAELGRMHVGSDGDMDDEMVEAVMKHARDTDNWSGDGTHYEESYEDGWVKIIKMSPVMASFFDNPPGKVVAS